MRNFLFLFGNGLVTAVMVTPTPFGFVCFVFFIGGGDGSGKNSASDY